MRKPRDVKSFLETAAIIVGGLGVLAYGVLRTAYYAYYQEFKVSPEQAGIDKTELLSAALVGPAIQLASLLAAAFLIVAIPVLLAWAFTFNLDRYNPGRVGLFSLTRRQAVWRWFKFFFWPVFIVFMVVGTAGLITFLMIRANQAALRATRDHESLYAVTIGIGDYSLPVLEIRAIPAEVGWILSKPIPTALVDRRPPMPGVTWSKRDRKLAEVNECLMYIGETADTYLVYDALHGNTVAFSKDEVAVELQPHVSYLPPSCPRHALQPPQIESTPQEIQLPGYDPNTIVDSPT